MIDNESAFSSNEDEGRERPGKPKVVVKDPEDKGERPGEPKEVVKDPDDDGEKDPRLGSY